MRATVSHFEIPARDLERAARFYREAFGWHVEPLTWEGRPHYTVRMRGLAGDVGEPPSSSPGRQPPDGQSARRASEVGKGAAFGINGGLTENDGSLVHPLLVIHIAGADLPSCLERIVACEGSIDLPVTRVGSFGLFARFRDPEGNLLGLWQGFEPP